MNSLSIMSWNINNDRRVEFNGIASREFADWSLSNRLPAIINLIANSKTNILALFEIGFEYIHPIINELIKLGYKTIHGSYSPNQTPNFSLYYIIGYDNSVILIENHMYWFTDTPLIPLTTESRKVDTVLSRNKEEYEKGTLISIFEYNGIRFVYSVVHLGLRKSYQIECVQMLIDHLNSFKLPIIVSGDFNTFPDFVNGIDDTLTLFENAGYDHCKNDKDTFLGYAYDLGAPTTPEKKIDIQTAQNIIKTMITSDASYFEIRQAYVKSILDIHKKPIMGTLDHIFFKNIPRSIKYTINVIDTSIMERDIIQLFKDKAHEKPLTPSDHFALVIRFD